jgi:DNA invertase Pin-like site-specific DNA recombinase
MLMQHSTLITLILLCYIWSFPNVLPSLAQFERRLIQERTKAGLDAARSRGKNGGRPKITTNDAKVLAVKNMFKNKDVSVKQICESLKISRYTLYRYLKVV